MTSGHKFQKGDRVVLLDGKYVYQGIERPDLSADLAGVVGVVTRERGRKTSEHDPDYGVLFEHERCEGNNTHYVDEGALILESDLVSDEDVAAAIASIVSGVTMEASPQMFVLYEDFGYEGNQFQALCTDMDTAKRIAQERHDIYHTTTITWTPENDGGAKGESYYIVPVPLNVRYVL